MLPLHHAPTDPRRDDARFIIGHSGANVKRKTPERQGFFRSTAHPGRRRFQGEPGAIQGRQRPRNLNDLRGSGVVEAIRAELVDCTSPSILFGTGFARREIHLPHPRAGVPKLLLDTDPGHVADRFRGSLCPNSQAVRSTRRSARRGCRRFRWPRASHKVEGQKSRPGDCLPMHAMGPKCGGHHGICESGGGLSLFGY